MLINGVTIRAKIDEGFTFQAPNGEPLTLAVIDAGGHVVATGDSVSSAVFSTAIEAHEEFWIGNGSMAIVR